MLPNENSPPSEENLTLELLSRRYTRLFEASQDGVMLFEFPDGLLIDANPYILNLLGYSKAELMGKKLWQLGLLADKAQALEVHERILSKSYVRYENLDLVTKEGRSIPVEVVCSAYAGNGEGNKIIQCTIRDISIRKDAQEELVRHRSIERDDSLSQERSRVSEQIFETVNSLSNVIEARDPYTASHQRRVTALAVLIAREMSLPPNMIDGLRFSAQIHDIGKIGIPNEVLTKPTALNSMEIAILRGHAQAGYDILRPLNFPWPVAKIILQHHERIDGSGYPQGLKHDEICLEARILGVADTVEAMTSDRPYRLGFGLDKALEELEAQKGVCYDPDVVDACLRVFRERNFQFPKEPEPSYHKL